MKRNPTKAIWIQNVWLWNSRLAFVRTLCVVPHQLTLVPAGAVRTL